MDKFAQLEKIRQKLQADLDAAKTKLERNIKGQFSTPLALANDILSHGKNLLPQTTQVRFLDPAAGTGVFFTALNNKFHTNQIEAITGYEIDEHYGKPALNLWKDTIVDYKLADFTKASYPQDEESKYNLLICNPPYVRHHHIKEQKQRLQNQAVISAKMKLSGLASLYCYFIAISHRWLKENGVAGWLIPSEFMDVNYGFAVKDYLLNEVTLLQIHRYDPNDLQFDDALVSSAVVWFKNRKPDKNHEIEFTFGGTIDNPLQKKKVSSDILTNEPKWTRFPLSERSIKNGIPKLCDFFAIKRGIATGDNNFFILSADEIKEKNLPIEHFRPILPSPRYLKETEVRADKDGIPLLDKKLFVLDCKLSFDEIKQDYPNLYDYLQEGIEQGVSERYLCKSRKIWYSQENRPKSYFYCTYIGRTKNEENAPFRFILNHSKAIVANSYLILYPKPNLERKIAANNNIRKLVIDALNKITGRSMIDEGRVYGGGMYKMEPRELSNVSALEIHRIFAF